MFPLAEPPRSPWRLLWRAPQLSGQPNQIVCDVNVIEPFGEGGGKFKEVCARKQSIERALRSHTVVFEQRRVGSFGSNQIVASIVSRPDNHVMRSQYFKRLHQNCRCKVRTVAIERDDLLPAAPSEVPKYGG